MIIRSSSELLSSTCSVPGIVVTCEVTKLELAYDPVKPTGEARLRRVRGCRAGHVQGPGGSDRGGGCILGSLPPPLPSNGGRRHHSTGGGAAAPSGVLGLSPASVGARRNHARSSVGHSMAHRPGVLMRKCVVVGNGAVSKTCLLMSCASYAFPEKHVPTFFSHYTVSITVGGKQYLLGQL